MIISQQELELMPSRYRATLINSLAGVKQVVLVGTQSVSGQSNLAIFNSLIHIGANPPLYGLLFRPDTVQRDTLKNILETNLYTLNYVPITDAEKAHQTAARYETGISEFKQVGFEEEYISPIDAPFIKHAPVKVAMKFEERVDIKLNDTILIIGSIQSIQLDNAFLGDDGFVALHKTKLLAVSGLDAYHETKFIKRLSYAKPDVWPNEIM